MKFEKFEDLPVWQKARELCKRVFEVTSVEPFKNDYKFRDQIKASSGPDIKAINICTNNSILNLEY